MAGRGRNRGRRRRPGPAELRGHGGRDDTGHAAGIDQVEVRELDRHVQGDPVVAHAALDAQPERADLARGGSVGVHPAARMSVATAGLDAERPARVDHRALERAHQRPYEQAPTAQADDRVGHQLARAVVGHLAAPFDADDVDPARCERLGRGEDMRRIRGAAEREHGRVLEQQQLVADPVVGARSGQPLLQRPGPFVGDPAEPVHLEAPRNDPRGARLHRRHQRGVHRRTITGRPVPPIPRRPAVWQHRR